MDPVVEQESPATWESNKEEVPLDPQKQSEEVTAHGKPSVPRFLLRIWQFIAAIGAFGFQVGATPVNKAHFYSYIVLNYIILIVFW